MKVNGIYRYTAIRRYPNNKTLQLDRGVTNGKTLDIYSLYENKELKHKLYLLYKDNWIKAKEVRYGE
jgi:hypothetical protein